MFKIKIYLHDPVDYDILKAALKKEGFIVISASKIGMQNKRIEEHLNCARLNNAVLLTNNRDFLSTKNKHNGILIIYNFKDPKKFMTLQKIIRAFKNIDNQIRTNRINIENRIYPLNIFI